MCVGETQSLLPDDLPPARVFAEHPPTFDEVRQAVCDHYGIHFDYLTGRVDRHATMVKAIIAYLLRRHAHMGVEEIARLVGYRNSSSVSAAATKVDGRLTVEELLQDDIDIIKRRIAHAILERSAPCQ